MADTQTTNNLNKNSHAGALFTNASKNHGTKPIETQHFSGNAPFNHNHQIKGSKANYISHVNTNEKPIQINKQLPNSKKMNPIIQPNINSNLNKEVIIEKFLNKKKTNKEVNYETDENFNELERIKSSQNKPLISIPRTFNKQESKPENNVSRSRSPDFQTNQITSQLSFEDEMKKHGLKNKLVDIERLSIYFENEIGSSRKNSKEPAPRQDASKVEQKIRFPFQKRPRSNSPPKQFLNQIKESNSKSIKQPVIPVNFIIGCNFSNNVNLHITSNKKTFEEEMMELIAASSIAPTNPTNENINEECADWLFKTILNKNKNDQELKQIPKAKVQKPEGDNEINFMNMLQQMNDLEQ